MSEQKEIPEEEPLEEPPEPKKRGRPRKEVPGPKKEPERKEIPEPKRRGRPRKEIPPEPRPEPRPDPRPDPRPEPRPEPEREPEFHNFMRDLYLMSNPRLAQHEQKKRRWASFNMG